MSAVIYHWPFLVLPARNLRWWPSGGVDSGGRSLSGLEILDRLDGGPIWRCAWDGTPLHGREKILVAQAMEGLLAGGAGLFVIPRRPGDRSPAITPAVPVPHSDGSPFSDETLYVGGSMSATLDVGADLNASELEITLAGALDLIGGEEFSITHGADIGKRMYRIVNLDNHGGGSYTVQIIPGLRDDVDADADLDFDNPGCVMRLSNPEGFSTPLDFNLLGSASPAFEEAFFT